MKAAVYCVGNRLMLDEGVGPAVYDELIKTYDFPDDLSIYDVGCMSLKMLPQVRDYDYIITVDAVDGSDSEPGTIFRFKPDDLMRKSGAMQSLHDLKLVDLFDAATLLGYEADGLCFGMQIENMSPAELTIGLTPKVYAALPKLVDTVLAELVQSGFVVTVKESGRIVDSSWEHSLRPDNKDFL